MLIVQILFWGCFLGVLHTYIFYPALMKWLYSRKQEGDGEFQEEDLFQPEVTVLMSVYNEAAVILQKLESIDAVHYPKSKLRIYIGSDSSKDGSDELISDFIKGKPEYHFFPFDNRSGKIVVIQRLIDQLKHENPIAPDHIFLFTDANVLLDTSAVQNLVRHFIQPQIAIVDTNMINLGSSAKGISRAEERYITGEVLLKHHEGAVWGCMMGAFGGCFAVRSTFFQRVPPNFIVDDFFITMSAMVDGGWVINDLNAKCYEAIPNDIGEEYKRKRRISAGNFQNLLYFRKVLWSRPWQRAFAFLSHKVLRWITPILLLTGLLCLVYLSLAHRWEYRLMLWIWVVVLFLVPLLDWLLFKMNIHIGIMRKVRYFVYMNIALLHGLIVYVNGIKTNVWQPPKRKSID